MEVKQFSGTSPITGLTSHAKDSIHATLSHVLQGLISKGDQIEFRIVSFELDFTASSPHCEPFDFTGGFKSPVAQGSRRNHQSRSSEIFIGRTTNPGSLVVDATQHGLSDSWCGVSVVARPGREQSREASSHVERDENRSAMRARLDRAGRGHETANACVLSGNQYAVLFENDEE